MDHDIQTDRVDSRPTIYATVFGIGVFAASYSVTRSATSLVGAALLGGLGAIQFPEASLRQPLILILEVVSGGVALWVSAGTTRRLFSSANQRTVVFSIALIVIALMSLNLLLGLETLRPTLGIYGVLAIAVGTLIATWIVRK